jgi:hypothetical protein
VRSRRCHSVLLLVLAIGVVATACSDDDDEPRAAGATTSTTDAATTTTIEDCDGAEPVPPKAADGAPAELAGEAGALRFFVVDHGASVDVLGVYRSVDCALEPVQLGGTAAALAVGGSVTHGDGIRCTADGLTVFTAVSDDGSTYQATAVAYELDGDELVVVDRTASTIDANEDPEELDAYYRLDCGSA